ncbi:uncharacterized protein EV154DRAFT_489103 [Mucor mucedo]|uniref:uncharacterized protein n=1 Tax=Mucor mucedo TaxID=29922 RepID=UPI00221F4C11|nr:uncharacterized protein EV154DRAFT_489103 [Mucor mucedo]KAI7863148.1 hypothetical protein EV154DRAFT_489103 [Mucor mucedo]
MHIERCIKSEYPENHGHLISQCLRMSNIQLPSEEEQSTASPIEERPMAVPRKRMAKENQEVSSSGKKSKSYASNAYIDDEASCQNDTEQSNTTSVVEPVEVPTTSSKEAEAIITPTVGIRQNMSILSAPLRLKAIRVLKMPTMTATTEQEDIDNFLKDILFHFNAGHTYDVLGKCIQYVGCYHFFCFLEESKLQGKGLHKKHMQAIKDGQYSKYQTRLLKATGKRLNVLLKDIKYGALAIVIPYSVAAFERWSWEKFQKFISVINQNKALTKELQDLQLHSSFLDKTGELNYVCYKDSD